MQQQTLKIATRDSPLALWQANHVADRLRQYYPDLDVQLVSMTTEGDRLLSAPLSQSGGKGLFIKELEQAMLDGEADIAVHSMKDVTVEFPQGLQLTAIIVREDPRDAFISNDFAGLAELPQGATVGTSSMRRRTQLMQLRPDLSIRDLRGNVGTRLRKLDEGQYAAIILAAAGVKRLGIADRARDYLPVGDMVPAIGQGAIGIESRSDDEATNSLIRPLDDPLTHQLVAAERVISKRLYGGCQLPIAAHATAAGDVVTLRAMVGRLDGSEVLREDGNSPLRDSDALGERVADALLDRGADEILKEVLGNQQ